MIKDIKLIDGYKIIVCEIKFLLKNYYFKKNIYNKCISLYEDSLLYFSQIMIKLKI